MAMRLFCFPIITAVLSLLLGSSASADPLNSYRVGTGWPCRDGYQRMGNYCRKIFVPANADVKGSQWYCKAGYTRQANACIKLSSVKN
jgi:hypothetical protein